METDEQQTPPQNAAGLDRAGTRHGGAANATEAGRPDAAEPSSERPGDQEGPITVDGSQRPPDPRVSSVPLDTEEPGSAADRTDPARTAEEQRELERDAPISGDGPTADGDRPGGTAP